MLPTDFKIFDVEQNGMVIRLAQQSYLETASPIPMNFRASFDPTHFVTDDELFSYRTIPGHFGWVANVSSPLSAFPASVTVQEQTKPLSSPQISLVALHRFMNESSATILSISLKFPFFSLRIYTERAFKSPKDKHFQSKYAFLLSNRYIRSKIIHFHRPCGSRRPGSTEELEHLAFNQALRSVCDHH